MKQLTIIILVLAAIFSPALSSMGQPPSAGQVPPGVQSAQFGSQTGPVYVYETLPYIDGNDTLPQLAFLPLYMISSHKGRVLKQYDMTKLVYNVKKVYPIAKEANRRLNEVEAALKTMHSSKDQNAYVKQVEKQLKDQYTPVLKDMTFSQGKILIKLIDRETDNTSYQLVKQLRGGFSAFFWQGIARIFGANLKDTYQRDGEDIIIEQIILLYEAGQI